jgi:hypothetical protein
VFSAYDRRVFPGTLARLHEPIFRGGTKFISKVSIGVHDEPATIGAARRSSRPSRCCQTARPLNEQPVYG